MTGRPRDPERDAVILAATLALLAEVGLGGTTVEAVASRAGVGKATIYRRFPTREALIVAAVTSATAPLPDPDTGDVRGDICLMLGAIGRRTGSNSERVLPRILAEAVSNPELHRRYRESFIEPRRARFRQVLGRGRDRGELRADLDLDRAVDLFVGAVIYRRMLTGAAGALPADVVSGLVDDVLLGLRPR